MEVACYAGARYPERPQRVTWRGAQRDVLAVEREWQEPGKRCFLVRLVRSADSAPGGEDDLVLRLCYYERNDRWTAAEVGGG